MKITVAEWILRVTHPNGECCQNLVSHTLLVHLSKSEFVGYCFKSLVPEYDDPLAL